MPSWSRICCAVDLSDASRAALDAACSLAGSLGAALVLLHVWDAPPGASAAPFAPPPRPVRSNGDEERRRLGEWLEGANARIGGRATLVERHGAPGQEIVAYTSEEGCDLLVVGTHGRSGLRRALLGSVSEAVVRTAGCPVLVVPPKGRGAEI